VKHTAKLFGALIASAALAACGGGDQAEESQAADAGADNAAGASAPDTASSAMETAAADTDSAMNEMESAAADAADAGEAMADAAGDAMADAGDAMGDAGEAAEAAANDAMESASEAAEAATQSGDGELMFASFEADAQAGRRVFARCRSCHVLDEGQNRVGPSLYGIFGREAGTVEGFRYSDANANSGITWTKQIMFEYLENPQEYIPGTYMAFPGLPDPQDRADVVAYIAENGGEAG